MLQEEGLLVITAFTPVSNRISMRQCCWIIKKPIVSDIRWVDWEYIDENEDYFPHVHERFRIASVDDFVGLKLTKWND